MKDIIDRLRSNYDHETTRASRQADLKSIMDRGQGSRDKDRFGWIIGAAAVFAVVVVGGVALANRSPLESRATADVSDSATATTAPLLLTDQEPRWDEEGITDFVVDPWSHQTLAEGDGILYGISTSPAPDTRLGWTEHLARSEDGGVTWQEIAKPDDALAGLTVADGVLYSVSTTAEPLGANVHVSHDQGDTWESAPVPIGSEIDNVYFGGVVPAPNGGVLMATGEFTNLVERVVPEEFRGEGFRTIVVDQEMIEPMDENRSTTDEANNTPTIRDGEAETTKPIQEDGVDDAEFLTVPPATGPPGEQRVVVLDRNQQVVFEETLSALGIDDPHHWAGRVFHIDPDGSLTEIETNLDAEGMVGNPILTVKLHDLGEAVLVTGWNNDGYVGAISKDGAEWRPIDLSGVGEIVATGSVDGKAVMIGQSYQEDDLGIRALVSDDPMGEWTEIDLSEYLTDFEFEPVRGEVSDSGVVITHLRRQEGQTNEDTLVGGEILSSPDLRTWSVQDIGELGDGKINAFGPAYSIDDNMYLTGLDIDGNRVSERHIFSTQLNMD